MRVAYVCADPGVPVFGRKGSSIHVQEVVRGLMSRGVRVDLFAARTDGDPLPGASPASVHRLPAAEAGELAARERSLFESNVALRQVLEREGPFDLVYERHSLWSFAAMEYAEERRIPALLEVNAPLVEEQSSYRGLIDVEAARRATHRAYSAASALLAVSETLAEYLEEQDSSRGRVHVLTNGVDPERFNPEVPPALPAEPGAFRVGFAGSLKAWHGLATLAEAFARLHGQHPSARLLIVGDGPERDRLTEQLRSVGVAEAACFTGTVDPAEMPGWLTSMDVAVAPYPPLEPFYFSPLKVFEYMAAGLPVVASRVGQVAGLLEHGVTGLLCSAGDAGSLAGALSQLAEDPELRRCLGANARAAVSRDHTWEAVTERILQLASITHVPGRAR